VKRFIGIVAAALAGFTSGAMAADLPAYKARPMAAPAPSWTGFYIGGHGGWGWSDTNATASSAPLTGIFAAPFVFAPLGTYDVGSDGAVFGGQLGYNWQAGNWVVGVEGDFSGAGINGFQSQMLQPTPAGFGAGTGGTSFMRQEINWLASARARLGYTWGPSLLYVTGGAAWANVDYRADANPTGFTTVCCAFPAAFGGTRSGWTVGGGFEYMLNGNWTVRGEYLYYSFDGASATVPLTSVPPPAVLASRATYTFGDLDLHVLRVGVNYKFGGDSAYAAMAADLPAYKARPAAAPVLPSWTGFYVGAHAGWGWSDTRATASSSAPGAFFPLAGSVFLPASYDVGADGAVFGGQLGYNWQAGNWVVGVEGDFSGAGISGFQSQALQLNPIIGVPVGPRGTSFMSQDINWLASIRGRLGYAWGPSLLYVTGGAAWADVAYRADASPTGFFVGCCAFPASFSNTRSGWTVGGGFEYMITGNWTVRGEYLYYSFDGDTITAPVASSVPLAVTSSATYTFDKLDLHVVRAGLNYKF
jgi:outer membrane immunogenic protein